MVAVRVTRLVKFAPIGRVENSGSQGDQIGQICAYWAIVYFEQFFDTCKRGPHFGLLFNSVWSVY
jgi:hypothetical protein